MVTDFLIRIKNAGMAKNKEVEIKLDKYVLAVANALKKVGILDTISKEKDVLKVTLAFKNKRPVLRNLKLVTKPGLKVYRSVSDLEVHKRPSVFLVSTSKGIVSSKEAVKARQGGEVIVEIW